MRNAGISKKKSGPNYNREESDSTYNSSCDNTNLSDSAMSNDDNDFVHDLNNEANSSSENKTDNSNNSNVYRAGNIYKDDDNKNRRNEVVISIVDQLSNDLLLYNNSEITKNKSILILMDLYVQSYENNSECYTKDVATTSS